MKKEKSCDDLKMVGFDTPAIRALLKQHPAKKETLTDLLVEAFENAEFV